MIGQKGMPAHSGGVERHVDDLSRRLVSAGHEVIVYCRKGYSLNKKLVHEYSGVKLVYLPTLKNKYLETVLHVFFASLHAIFMKADTIHYHGIGPSIFLWIPKLFCPSAKVISTFHCQDYYHQKWGIFSRLAFRVGEWMACRVPDKTLVVSKYLQRYVQKKYNKRAIYIPNAVPLSERVYAHSIKQFGLTTGNYILSVSRLVKHKGIHTLIAAYQKLSESRKDIPYLVIVGGSVFTDVYVESLRKSAKGNERILFLGEQNGELLKELYSNARLFVQPSETEGLSYALLEAMSFGCPVLVSDIAENTEVLPSLGYTFQNKNTADLTEKLESILATKNKALSHTGSLNREQVKKYYNLDLVMHRVLKFYTQNSRI